jgi:hypothetical protein
MLGEPDDETDASSCVVNVPLLGSSETDDKVQRQKEADLLKWAAAELNKRSGWKLCT